MLALRVLYQDDWLVVVDKPAGFHTHPPEDENIRIHPRWNGLGILERQFGQRLYPVHRLDRASSGVLVYSRQRECNSALQKQFAQQTVYKRYALLARGRIQSSMRLDEELQQKGGEPLAAVTELEPLFSFGLSLGDGTARDFTLAWAHPVTGRFHQIRRHCAHAGHPLLGDKQHGDKKLNRAVAATNQLDRLYLRCMEMRFQHPVEDREVAVRARWSRDWHKLFGLAGYCPIAGAKD